jgi:hypothetical protein
MILPSNLHLPTPGIDTLVLMALKLSSLWGLPYGFYRSSLETVVGSSGI